MDKVKKCWVCGRTDFESWDDLANHKLTEKDKAHKHDRSGTLWAKKYIHRNAINKLQKIGRELPYRVPLTDEQREAKIDTRRELSGETKLVVTICPKCNKGERKMIEVEHADESESWRIKNCPVVLCGGCK